MIKEMDIRRRGDAILVGIAIESAILDFETTETLLRTALEMLDRPRKGADWMKIGVFGEFPVTLHLASGDSLSIVIDGPYFESNRSVCAMIHLNKSEFREVVNRASLSP